ncbi:arrestin homolog [Argiope bruennichi]|uniref:arrestin homolog n=1 Tax=Argiope bruennichi TaxID=94029 RepID=UPI0024941021|nr:arrestin homolog [Argiope bruennichi]
MPTAVLKKQSPNGLLTVYLSRRELIVEEGGVVRPIDGVVLTDPDLSAQHEPFKIFALVVLTFRYGREDEEVMGLKFYTEAILHYEQVYPSSSKSPRPLTALQQHLLKKLGPDAHPLTVSVSGHAPHSVGLKPARAYGGSPLGVTYDLKVFPGNRADEKPSKRNLVRLSLRCTHRSPAPFPNPPAAALSRAFVFSSGKLRLEARLDKEAYRYDETLQVHVSLDNSSNRTVHRVRVTLVQYVNVCMFTNGRFKNIVGLSETEPGHPVRPGSCLSRVFHVKPTVHMRYPVALAIEGGLSNSTVKLSPSTIPALATERNPYGVTVCYEVKVKAFLGVVDRPVCLRLPFRIIEDPPVIEEEEPVPLTEEEEEKESVFPT